MSQKITTKNRPAKHRKDGLSPRQIRAVESLLDSDTISAAAKDAGVRRETLHRWMQKNSNFRATYNMLKREMVQDVENRLLISAAHATDILHDRLDPEIPGTTQIAIELLKDMGFLKGNLPVIGSDVPKRLQDEAELQELELSVLRQNLRKQAEAERKNRKIRRIKIRPVPTPTDTDVEGPEGQDKQVVESGA